MFHCMLLCIFQIENIVKIKQPVVEKMLWFASLPKLRLQLHIKATQIDG